MQINPSGAYTPASPSQLGGAERAASRPQQAAGAGAEVSSYTPTPDLTRLLQSVRQMPDVRPEAIAAAGALVASGDLQTPGAVADTAQAILDNLTHPAN
jgi:hypothetical protein